MGMLFRTASLLNGNLFNTEALFPMSENHIQSLGESAKYFLCKLFDTTVSTPIESLYIESAAIPIRFLLIGRRMMYYWSILQKGQMKL